jgi:hypothetical protein
VNADGLVKAYLLCPFIILTQLCIQRKEARIIPLELSAPMIMPSLKLNDGTSIPVIGFGTGKLRPPSETPSYTNNQGPLISAKSAQSMSSRLLKWGIGT